MTAEQIEHYLDDNPFDSNRSSRVSFKARNPFEGMFIKASDYPELRKKNFWRMVAASRMEEYRQSKDLNLSRIFNGDSFTKLAVNTEKERT
jgi:hypothetical protein